VQIRVRPIRLLFRPISFLRLALPIDPPLKSQILKSEIAIVVEIENQAINPKYCLAPAIRRSKKPLNPFSDVLAEVR
jgi:hypothetical protein